MLAARGQLPRIALADDGEDAARLEALPKSSDVTFPGFLTEEKQDFFDACFAMALPSVTAQGDVQGMPIALLEPMTASETPISHQDARNHLRHDGMRADRDWLPFDRALSYGLAEYLRTLALLPDDGCSNRNVIHDGATGCRSTSPRG